MGTFDDLVPSSAKSAGAFSDLVPVIDFNGPDDAVRTAIAALPETAKKAAMDRWGEARVAKLRNAGLDQHPDAARGIPLIGGFLDEATAGIQSGLHSLSGGRLGMPYDEALAFERARQRASDAANPAESAIGQIAAGVATGGPIFSRIPAAQTLAGRVGQGAAIGGVLGAEEGFARGEGGVANRIDNASHGLQAGAVVGGVLPMAAAGLSRAYGAASDLMSPGITRMRSGPEAAADEILARRMASEGSSPAAKRLDLQSGQQAARVNPGSTATLPETIADTSDAMQRLTGSVYRAGGEAGNAVRQSLQSRQQGPINPYEPQPAGVGPQGQRARIMDTTERTLLIRSADSARQTEQRIMRQQADEGRRLYAQAEREGLSPANTFDLQPAIDAMALVTQQYPAPFAARLQRAINLFRDDSPNRMPVNTINRFDASKKSLDDMIETAQRQGSGNLVRELTQFKQSLLQQVHAGGRNPAYAEARAAWGSAAENREAIDLGRAALRQGSEISAEQYRDLTRGQQQLFRIGFLESLRNALGTRRPGNDITQIFQQARVQELMNEIIPRSRGNGVFSDRPARFGEIMRREERMVGTRNSVLGNSATAQRQQDDAAFAGDTLRSMWDRFRQSPSLFNMGVEAIGSGIQSVFGYRQDVALALARRLLETDRTAQNQILRRLQQRGGPDVFQRFANEIDRASLTLSAPLAQQAIPDQRGGVR